MPALPTMWILLTMSTSPTMSALPIVSTMSILSTMQRIHYPIWGLNEFLRSHKIFWDLTRFFEISLDILRSNNFLRSITFFEISQDFLRSHKIFWDLTRFFEIQLFFEIHNIFLRSHKIFWDLIRFLISNFLRSKEIFWYQKLWILLIVACQNPKYNIKIWIAFVKITKNIKSAPLAHHLRPIFGLVYLFALFEQLFQF